VKEFIVASWDDVHLKSGEKVPAEKTIHLGVDGTWYELDLNEENHGQLMEDLRFWLDAAHKPDGLDEPPREKRRYRTDSGNITRNRLLRDFADAHGLNYKTESGKYYYSIALRNAFAAYEAGAPEAEWRKIYQAKAAPGRKKDK